MEIEGKWYNELGSVVNFEVNGGQLSGIYHTAVGDAEGIYPLTGRINTSVETGQAIGFVVVWQNEWRDSNSVTAWSGQTQVINGADTIITTWLLTDETPVEDDWKSTIVGKDTFTRIPQATEKKGAAAFPKNKK